ncbi:alpha-amylase family glycosyl hydrolase [Paraurantiacibacter namhicola]|uniref:Alpha-amylase n=1 Tax=Paraurantiacibacter namhicola TaxID=645517 RepID=A0A1C7D788_9SPHN|nr:alpha-amylase family glycosyl hydrolase [Paraurantiacibacter namhicola]ANU07163.1 Alpha-amylase precursor [Paraurantiacibacter namhicola]
MTRTHQILAFVSALALAGCGGSNAVASTPSPAPEQAEAGSTGASPSAEVLAIDYRQRPPSDEVIYFVLPDRFENGDTSNDLGGFTGGPLQHGFDPTHKGFFHGGDLAGLTARLPYLKRMGITAIWFAPIFQNKPVQGGEGEESAGYHGYWVTDFTRPDAHFGTADEFRAFVDAAHGMGMKVYMDIITNHTADVIGYEEGPETGYKYRSRGDYPYVTRGDVGGARINEGFEGDQVSTDENFARLTAPDFAYTPVVKDAERDIKVPAWLNDPIYYHNRGDTTFDGESNTFGDFVGLDDLFTEHPRVREGMIDIYRFWVTDYGVDGFRIDTFRHVDPGFWQAFLPAITQTANAEGKPNFTMFAEVARNEPNAGYFAQFTRRDGVPAVLDFAFQSAMQDVLGKAKGTDTLMELFAGDVLYEGGEEAAMNMPTFLGNHDMGRFSTLVRQDRPGISQDELLSRVMLGHAMMFTLRGAPTVYYGDEQGFVGDAHDQLAREDMFPSRTAVYNDNNLIGTDATTAVSNFDEAHPLYRLVASLSEMRAEHPALRRGRQVTREFRTKPGLFAVSRFDPDTGTEYYIAFNTSDAPIVENAVIGSNARSLETLAGTCPGSVTVPGSVRIELPAFGWAVCRVSETAK